MNVLLVIPLYNHAATVRQVVERALAVHPRVLVVDDGSTDGGAKTLTGLPVTVVSHPVNRGKGAAILTAAHEAYKMGMTHIVTLDADGQHDPADFPRFLSAIESDPEAVVVGTRDFNTENVPGSSRFGRRFSNFWLRLQTGKSLGDTQSGFRAYPLMLLEQLKFTQRHYSFEVEVLVKAAWAGIALREVPISVYYPPAGERVSHFGAFRDNFRLTLLNTHLTMRSVLPWPHRKIVTDRQSGEKVSVLHPLRSLRTLLTENASPAQLAAAGFLGVFLGTLPLIALHTVAILFAAGFLRLNKVAAVSASQLCMPPLVPAICIEVGYFIRHGEFLTEFTMQTLGYQGLERLYEWLLGSLLVAPLLAGLVGALIYATALIVRGGMRARPDAPKSGAWSSRSIGSKLQHQIFYLLIRLGGRRAAYALLYFVVLYYVLFRLSVRKRTFPYLRRRFPRKGGRPSLRDSYRMSLELGKVLVDRAVVGILGPSAMSVRLEGREKLLELVGEGKGVILMTAHVGCWQVAMSALGFLRMPVNLLMQREDGDIDRHFFEHAGIECPYKIIDPRGFLGGALEMIAVLKQGEVLSIMGDRMLGSDLNGVESDFLGAPVRFPFSAYKLASATGAPVAVVFSAKTGPDNYELKLYDFFRVPGGLGRGEAEFAPHAGRFAQALERFCEEHPYQFFNFFDLWQNPDGHDA